MSNQNRRWDKYDQEAYELYELEEYLRREGLLTKHDPKYVSKCYYCNGTGQRYDKLTYEILGPCPKCGGARHKAPKQKFTGKEVIDIMDKLGSKKVMELVRRYGEQRKKS